MTARPGAARVAWIAAVAVCLAAAAAPTVGAEVLLPATSVWKYEATGTDLGTAWRAPGYADGAWPSGPGVLGYGETYITTHVPYGPDSGNKHPTTYFRTTFTLGTDPSQIQSLSVAVNYDDGFALYLNGIEVTRQALAPGAAYGAFATAQHEGGVYATLDLLPYASALVSGTNVLAAEVHQVNGTSSDLVWDAELTGSTLPAVSRGPYLQVGRPDGVTVRWRTGVVATSGLFTGPAPDSLTLSVQDATLTTEHELTVNGLDPDTRTYYAVGTTDTVLAGGTPDFAFRTSPLPGTRRPVRAWIIGDSGTANPNAAAVRDAYLALTGGAETDVWLMLGDNAYSSGTDLQYQAAVFDMYPGILRNTVLWPTRGNHDQLYTGADKDYYEIFTLPEAAQAGGVASMSEAYYSFDYADVHFVCLDSEGSNRTPGGAMLTWLATDLAATTQDWIVAFWHHPPYTKGSHDSDNAGDSGGRMRDMRENALPILEAGGVDVVFTGHSHSYERSYLLDGHYDVSTTLDPSMILDAGDGDPAGNGPYGKPTVGPGSHEGAVYVVAGSSGQTGGGNLNHPVMVRSLNTLGSVVLEVDGTQLDARFLSSTGAILDDFSIVKGVTAVPLEPPPPGTLVNYPNPFASGTRIAFTLETAGPVGIRIVDVSGRLVRTVLDGDRLPVGPHTVIWDGADRHGTRVAPGVYFAVLRFESGTRTRRLVLRP